MEDVPINRGGGGGAEYNRHITVQHNYPLYSRSFLTKSQSENAKRTF